MTSAAMHIPLNSQDSEQSDPLTNAQQAAILLAALQHVTREMPSAAKFVEDAAGNIVGEFRQMAEVNTKQAKNIEEVLELARFIKVGHENIPFQRCIDILYQPLSEAISNILDVSKLAMSMVMAISQAAENIKRVEHYIHEIQDITKQTNMLAMNTQIEAARAGEAGKSFQYIAGEVKTLSQDIKNLAGEMERDIAEVASSVKDSFKVIDELANYDMTDNLSLKSRIDQVVEAISEQNRTYNSMLEEAVQMNINNARNINQMVMNIQFQDRNTQVIGGLVTILKQFHQFAALQMYSVESQLESQAAQDFVEETLRDIKLTDMRRQLVHALVEMGVLANHVPVVQKYTVHHGSTSTALESSEGDIDLF